MAPANYNTPQQIVIGGEVAAVDQAMTLLKEAGVKRMIPLNEWPFPYGAVTTSIKNWPRI